MVSQSRPIPRYSPMICIISALNAMNRWPMPYADKVTVECDAVPKIDETDICVIFANAADNAVAAVSKLSNEEKFIKVAVKSRGDLLFIEFENSFDGKPFEIGTGIKNIISAAEKYGGTAKISAQGKTFSLKILCNSQH